MSQRGFKKVWAQVPTEEEASPQRCAAAFLEVDGEAAVLADEAQDASAPSRSRWVLSRGAAAKLSLAGFAVAAVLAMVLAATLEQERRQLGEANEREEAHRRSLLWTPQIYGEDGLVDSAKDWARRNIKRNLSRHASAHLFYQPPQQTGKIKAWYHTLQPRRSADDTYFAVLGNGYGYFGLQQVRGFPWFEGKVVFSMWDQAGTRVRVRECGHGTFCTRFGGEGTGAKTYRQFNKWQLGSQYGFMIRSYDVGSTAVRQEAFLFAPELGGWVLMGVLEVVKANQNMPWDIKGMYSFVEQWTPRDFGSARWARLGPSFVQYEGEDGWKQVQTAVFRPDTNGNGWEKRGNCNANVTDNRRKWGLGVGGHVGSSEEEDHEQLKVVAAHQLPSPLVVFGELEVGGLLPRGCPDGTCTDLYIAEWYYFFFAPSNLGRTCVIAAIAFGLSIALMGLVCMCCQPSNDYVRRSGIQEVRCPGDHQLATFLAPNDTFTCDACGKSVSKGTTLHGCHKCKYDICKGCMSKTLKALQVAHKSPTSAGDPGSESSSDGEGSKAGSKA